MAKKRQLPATSAWQLEVVRLVAFPAAPPILTDQHWWRDIVADEPTDFYSTRGRGIRHEKGSFQGALLSLTVDTTRVVWEALPPGAVDEAGNFPTFDTPLREKLDWFVELLEPWLRKSCPALLRLAFSANLLQPAANANEAYRVLAAHLPIENLLDSTPNDLFVQINRRKPRSDVVNGLPINRVCAWSKKNLAIATERGRPFQWPKRCYSALELDINTAPEKAEPLPAGSLFELFKELESIGIDIAERGDTP